MKIYALAEYTYDWYEWEKVEATSFRRERLVELYNSTEQYSYPLIDIKDYDNYARQEIFHYCIIEVPFFK